MSPLPAFQKVERLWTSAPARTSSHVTTALAIFKDVSGFSDDRTSVSTGRPRLVGANVTWYWFGTNDDSTEAFVVG